MRAVLDLIFDLDTNMRSFRKRDLADPDIVRGESDVDSLRYSSLPIYKLMRIMFNLRLSPQQIR